MDVLPGLERVTDMYTCAVCARLPPLEKAALYQCKGQTCASACSFAQQSPSCIGLEFVMYPPVSDLLALLRNQCRDQCCRD